MYIILLFVPLFVFIQILVYLDMKKLFFALIFSGLLLVSCNDPSLPIIDGMWQLKTLETKEGKQTIDTIFYSFQYQRLFSVTILNADNIKTWSPNDPTVIFYGYTHFSGENQLTLELNVPENLYPVDRVNFKHEDYWQFIPWATPDKVKSSSDLTIQKHSSKSLVLKHNDTGDIYSFIKF